MASTSLPLYPCIASVHTGSRGGGGGGVNRKKSQERVPVSSHPLLGPTCPKGLIGLDSQYQLMKASGRGGTREGIEE